MPCCVSCWSWATPGAQTSTPAAPTIDSVTPGDTQLKVAWTAPAGETGITAYDVRHIETSEDETDDTKWTVVDDAWTSGVLAYTITGLDNGIQYDVQVRAVNSNGDGTLVRNRDRDASIAPLPPSVPCAQTTRAMLVSWGEPTGISTGVRAYDGAIYRDQRRREHRFQLDRGRGLPGKMAAAV